MGRALSILSIHLIRNFGVLFPRDLQRETYKLEATAQDKGYPPLSRSVEVQIDVVDRANNPPVWDHTVYGPIFIRENFPVGAKVVSVKARSVPQYHIVLLRLSVLNKISVVLSV